MFQIKVKQPDEKQDLYVVFKCPKCGWEGSFRFYAPERCEKCFEALPNVATLLTDAHDKILYYKYGCTMSPRTFDENIGTIIDRKSR